jgi:hypothetical protein
MSNDWKDQITDGLMNFQEVSQDGGIAKMGAQLVGLASGVLSPEIGPTDVCVLAFPSAAVLPNVRAATALVVILKDRLLVAYETGTFRKKSFIEKVPLAAISDVSWGAGTAAGTRGATMLTVSHKGGSLQFALPQRRTQLVASAVKTALTSGEFQLPEEPKVELAPSGRPQWVEDAIAKWFAFRRGEITQQEIGVSAMTFIGWMTDEEKQLDAQLLKESKGK